MNSSRIPLRTLPSAPRRRLMAALGAMLVPAGLLHSAGVRAAGLPEGQGTLVVPYPPGGPADTLARALAEGYSRAFRRSFVVDNKPGATGNIGAQQVARARPDGLTLLVTNTAVIMNPFLFTRTRVVDPFGELSPVTALASTSFAFVVPAKVPETTLAQWAERVRRSGRATYGSFGVGSTNHLYGHDLSQKLGLAFDHVPYKGDAPALQDLLAGTIDCAFISVVSSRAHVESGRLKALAVTGEGPNRSLPGVPTFAQLGIADFGIGGWLGVLAPAGTPLDVRQQLAAAAMDTLAQPEVRTRLSGAGLELSGTTVERFAELMRSESARQQARIKSSGASLD